METLRMNRTELLRFIVQRVMQEDANPETNHILWDWSCSSKLVSWFCGQMNKPFYIWIRKNGLECGYIEEVEKSCAVLGQPYLKMKITYLNYSDGYELTIE